MTLWKDNRGNRAPLVATIVLRLLLGVSFVMFVIAGLFKMSVGLVFGVAVLLVTLMILSRQLKKQSIICLLYTSNRNLSEEKQEILRELLFRMDAVKTAEDKKYVLMNAPKEKLDEIVSVLPGMKSPTVMPLAQEGWCSVHTVLDEKCFWEIIGKLKALGAEGILVLPIEKMII